MFFGVDGYLVELTSMKPPYGAWIDINGKVTDIGMCQHTQYLSYSDADDEGWICVVYGNKLLENSDTSSFFVRLNPNTVKEPALKALLKLINQTDKEQYMFSDMFQRDFPGHNNAKRGKTKMEARKFIRDIASDKINQ